MSNRFSWGSHIPINKTILKTFDITGVLELGSGFHSTPLFFENCDFVISVEQDLEWIKKMRDEAELIEDENHMIVHQDVSPYIRSSRRKEIDKNVLDSASDFFTEISQDPRLNFLFVDCYSGFRLEALNSIANFFDYVVFHDVQPRGMDNHSYKDFVPSKDFSRFKDTTFNCHCGILIKKEKLNEEIINEFKQNFEKEVAEYSGSEFFKPRLDIW